MGDSTVDDLRRQITENDRALIEAFNRRLELVERLWRHKNERGITIVDPEREQAIVDALAAANHGPLSDDGVDELVREILDLTKRELSRHETA
jgi:chorismate mutase